MGNQIFLNSSWEGQGALGLSYIRFFTLLFLNDRFANPDIYGRNMSCFSLERTEGISLAGDRTHSQNRLHTAHALLFVSNTETKEEAMNGTDSWCLPERIAFCPPCHLQALWAAGLRHCPAPSSVFGPSQLLNTTLLVFTVGLRKWTQETVGSFPKALCHRQSQSTDPEKYSSP